MSQTSPSYSLRPTHYRPHRVLLALIVTTSYSLSSSLPAPSLTSYSSLCILQLPSVCHYQSSTNQVTKLAIILAVSYSLSSSPRLTRSHSHHILLAIVLVTSTLIDIVCVTVYSTTSRCLCHSQSCANHVRKLTIILAASYSLSSSPRLTCSHIRHVLLASVLAAGVLIAILLIVIVLISSCRICM